MCTSIIAGHRVANNPPPIGINSSLPLAVPCKQQHGPVNAARPPRLWKRKNHEPSAPAREAQGIAPLPHRSCVSVNSVPRAGRGNAGTEAQCPRSATRLMLVRDPRRHFASLVEALRFNPGYLCGFVNLTSKCKLAVPLLLAPNATELQMVLPEYFDNLQTRFLLGFGLKNISPWRAWVGARSSSEIQRAVEAAVFDIDFIGITDNFDHTLAAAEVVFNRTIPTYRQVLHDTDSLKKHDSKPRRLLSRKRQAEIRRLNRWDALVYNTTVTRMQMILKGVTSIPASTCAKQCGRCRACGIGPHMKRDPFCIKTCVRAPVAK